MSIFQFKYFSIHQSRSALKVGTDAMLLGALIDPSGKTHALDIGTGTGVLSLMVAQKNDRLLITAIDVDANSLEDCRENVNHSPWKDRVLVVQQDILFHEPKQQYDLIFSNPPFYQNSLLSSDQRVATSKHANQLTFDLLFKRVSGMLADRGSFWGIFPGEYNNEIIQIALKNDLNVSRQVRIEGVPQRHTRTIFEFSRELTTVTDETMVVRELDGRYSEQYIELTKDYHNRSLK